MPSEWQGERLNILQFPLRYSIRIIHLERSTMAIILAPAWFTLSASTFDHLLTANVIWGFMLGVSSFVLIEAYQQIITVRKRSHKVQAYGMLVRAAWLSSFGLGVLAQTVIVGKIFPEYVTNSNVSSIFVVPMLMIH